MPRKALAVVLSLALPLSPILAIAQADVTDAEVRKGIRAVEEGDYDAAIFTLDAAARRLAADPSGARDLPQAYLYLGIAYVGKGHEAAAKAKFREALRQIKDLSLNADRYPPKVIDVFEAAKAENERDASARPAPAAARPATPPAPAPAAKKGGGGKTLLIVGGLAAVGGGGALAAGGGGSKSGNNTSSGVKTTAFPNEVVVFGGGRDFVVDVRGSGTLTARADWQQDGVLLSMYIVDLANPMRVLADGNQTASKQVSLSLPVTPASYRISVTNSTGAGPRVDTTFTLTVTHP